MNIATSGISIGTVNSSNESFNSNIPSQYKVLTLSFNQDCTAIAMGTVKAYSLFTIKQKNKIGQPFECKIEPCPAANYRPYEEVRIVERLFSSSLIILVTDQAPRKLNIFHYKKGTEIHSSSFQNTILAVKLNRSVFIVCLEESISIFDIRTSLKCIHTIDNIPSNPNGLCALSSAESAPYLAYPGSSITGEIHIFDTSNLKSGVMINAHDGPLVAMSFDMSGTRIATASDKGTVIRIYSAVDGSRLFDFRRGSLRSAIIYSLAFSPDSMFLAASGNTGTIHIFRLTDPTTSTPQETRTWIGYFGRAIGGAASYVSKPTSEIFTQDRSFATVHLHSTGLKTTIAMNNMNGKLILYVAGYDGVVSAYDVNTTDGGECKRISEDLLFNMFLSSNHEATTPIYAGRNETDETTGVYPPNAFENDCKTNQNSSE